MDADGSGRVEWPEYLRAMARMVLLGRGQHEMAEALNIFRGMALPGGEIPVEELRSLFQTAGDPLSDEEADAMMQLADPSGSGWVPLDRLLTLPCWELQGMQYI